MFLLRNLLSVSHRFAQSEPRFDLSCLAADFLQDGGSGSSGTGTVPSSETKAFPQEAKEHKEERKEVKERKEECIAQGARARVSFVWSDRRVCACS